jgi:hypothetical protein
LKKEIENLNKKLESKSSVNNNKSNFNASNISSANKNMNDNNLISKFLYQSDINEINNIISSSIFHKKNYDYLKGLKKIFKKASIKNSKRQNNFDITKSLYLNSNNNLKYNYNCSTVNTSGQNIFTINYNKICSNDKIKKIRKKTNKNARKSNKEKVEKEDNNKSLSLNKYIKKINHTRHRHRYKSNDKNKKSNNNINHFRPIESCPMSFQNKRSSKAKKFINQNIGINYKTYYGRKIKKIGSVLNF